MAIAGSDLPWYLSVKTGSAGSSTAGTPGGSLGRFISTTPWDQVTLQDNLLDDVTGDENSALDAEVRAVFVSNAHATLTLTAATVHIASQVPGGATCAIGLDPTGNVPVDSSSDQAVSVADENTMPVGVTFTDDAISRATGLSLGDLAPGYCRAVWIRRTATNSPPLDLDGVALAISGDTSE